MGLKGKIIPYRLKFNFQARTSRDVLEDKDTWFIKLSNKKSGDTGIGESGPIKGLSIDDISLMEEKLHTCLKLIGQENIPENYQEIRNLLKKLVPEEFPAIYFGLETAFLDLLNGGNRMIFANDFSLGKASLPINGLIWMGSLDYMEKQVQKKLGQGFDCIKLKIGSLDFEKELYLLEKIKKAAGSNITLRVDANGAFSEKEAPGKLDALSQMSIHSIEQPIKPGQWKAMAHLCRKSPIPIALDEELIGIENLNRKGELLDTINPQYIILKPTLLGGFWSTKEWINLAKDRNIGWWITSALESNIGLNAIAQFTAAYKPAIPQGLGTGMLYSNNIPAPLTIEQGKLSMDKTKNWDLTVLNN